MANPDTLHVRTQGAREQPVLLLLHGFLGSSADWDPLCGRFADQYYCITPDLPGHGDSLGLDDPAYTLEGAAALVLRALDNIGAGPCIGLGYSMGGRVLLSLAQSTPNRFRGLVLESVSPGIENDGDRAARRQTDENLAKRLEHEPLASFLEAWYAQPLFSSLAECPDLYPDLIHRRTRNRPDELARVLRGMGPGHHRPMWAGLSRLCMPVLCLAGAQDAKYMALNHRMADLSDNIRAAMVPHAGHNVHLEEPDAFLQEVEAFMRVTLAR